MSDSIDMMNRFNIDTIRVSKDRKVNSFGKQLIDSCKINNMLILNGRAFGDKGVGQTTCKDKPVVDYVICSSCSIAFLTNFEINEFCPLNSDAHNAIKFLLKGNIIPTRGTPSSHPTDKYKRWEESKKDLFLENLDQNKVNEILNTLNDIT